MRTSRAAVWYALILLFAINTLNFFDRQILGAIGEPVRKEFDLSDASLGLLGTAVVGRRALLAGGRTLLARRLAVFASLVAIFLGRLVVVRLVGTLGKRRRCRCTCQQKRDQDLTHDSDLSETLRRLVLLIR